jgi:protein-S-isoprenylcysteine O-methyltransferase Ste14
MQRMDRYHWLHLTGIAWTVFLVYWFISAFRLKAVKQREAPGQRLLHVIPMVISYLLLFRDDLSRGALAVRFAPDTQWIGETGFALVAIGIAFAIWARWHLGTNWSGTVTLKEDHELIRTGPYRNIRHPIYTGMLLALAGSAIALGEVRGLLGFVISWAALFFKARREENILRQEFGLKFQEHLQQTGMFLPRFS